MGWDPWLETVGIVLLSGGGAVAGERLARMKGWLWLLGYLPPLLCIVAVVMGRRFVGAALQAPLSWICAGRREFALMAVAHAMIFATLIVRAHSGRLKMLLGLMMATVVMVFSVFPFLATVLVKGKMERIEMRFSDSVCLQSTDYTCGPAAAVTALRMLGIDGDEGRIAIRAHTNPVVGTQADSLCLALTELYGSQGLECEHRFFGSMDDLPSGDLPSQEVAIVAVKRFFLVDHYVAVMGRVDGRIYIGDPLKGRRELTPKQFEALWLREGIVLRRHDGRRF